SPAGEVLYLARRRDRPQRAADASQEDAADACRSLTATQLSMRSNAWRSVRSAAGTGCALKNCSTSARFSREQNAPTAPAIRGMPWKMPSVLVRVSQFALTNAQAAS